MTKKRTRMAAPATKSRSLVASPPATSVNNANNGSVNVPLAPPAASMALPPPVAVSAPLKKKKKNKKKNKKQQQPQQQQQLQAPPPPPPNSAPVPAANAAVNNAVASSSSSHHHHHHHHHSSHHCDSPHGKDRADDFWQSSSSAEERQKIREFWLQLGEDERRSLVKVEKEAVLRKMKEQQKNSCNCSVCGKKRTAIEDELEVLYDAYYEELENYANHQQSTQQLYDPSGLHGFPAPGLYDTNFEDQFHDDDDDDDDHFDDLDDEDDDDLLDDDDYLDDDDDDDDHYDRFDITMMDDDDDDDEDDDDQVSDLSGEDDYSDSYDEEDMESFDPDGLVGSNLARLTHAADNISLGNSLTVKGGILTVADDLLKNDGKKFLDMMERLAERRMQRNEEAFVDQEEEDEEDDDYFDEDEDEDPDEIEEDVRTEEQRMRAGRKMFQMFAARMFEQRVHEAYREKVARERQQRLLEELEEEDRQRQERELKKQKDKEKKKDKKRQLKQQQEEERRAKEAQQKQEEARKRQEQERKLAAERERRESERQKKEEARRQRELDRLKKEEEKKRVKEEKERAVQAEREKKAKLEAERKAKHEAELKKKQQQQQLQQQQQQKQQVVPEKPKAKLPPGLSTANPLNHLNQSSPPLASPSTAPPAPADEVNRQQVLMDALMGSSKSTTPPPSTNSVATIAPSQPLHQQPPPQPMYHHPHPPPPPHIAHLQQQQPLHHPLMPSASHTTFQPSPSSTSSSSTPGNTSTPSLFQSIANPLAPSSSNTTALPTGSSPSLPSLSSQQNQPPTDASLASTFATSLLLSPPTTHSQLPPPSSTMDAFANGARRPSISTLNQLSFSDTTPQPPVAAPPGVSIPTHHNRRPSAMAGPIGSPVNSRFGAFDHFDTNSSNAANGLMQPDPSSSFFSNFLFGNQGIKPFNDQDLLGHSRLDVDRRFSMDSPFSNWRTNGGWPASTSLLADNVHGTQSRFDKTDRQAQVLDRAKVAYQKLDEITQAKYFLGGGSSSQYTMTQLHRMMSDLYCDTTVDSRELYEVLAQSAQFQCIQHPQQGVLVRYDAIPRAPTTSSAANAAAPAPPGTQDDPLRRTSMLPPHNAPQPPPGHPPASALHHQTSSPPFSFQPSLSTSLNYSFKNDR